MESVFAIKVRTGQLDLFGQDLARRRLRADISRGRIRVGPSIGERHFQNARQLLITHGPTMSLRTLDAIQLAVALDLLKIGAISVMVVADQRLCKAAAASDCSAMNPENPGVFTPQERWRCADRGVFKRVDAGGMRQGTGRERTSKNSLTCRPLEWSYSWDRLPGLGTRHHSFRPEVDPSNCVFCEVTVRTGRDGRKAIGDASSGQGVDS